jgi:hypothetical protein
VIFPLIISCSVSSKRFPQPENFSRILLCVKYTVEGSISTKGIRSGVCRMRGEKKQNPKQKKIAGNDNNTTDSFRFIQL